MSVSMIRADGVTVFTVTSDPNSRWPPLCQILNSLCCSPGCCSVSQNLKRVQKTSMSVLGALQIMIGLLNISLGIILDLSGSGSWYLFRFLGFPYWLGALFILFGIMCILSEKFPSQCLVILNVILNLAGAAFAITAFSLYMTNIMGPGWDCRPSYFSDTYLYSEDCTFSLSMMLLKGINGVLIVLSVLEFCVVISAVVLGIKALKNSEKEPNMDTACYKPLEEVSTKSAA